MRIAGSRRLQGTHRHVTVDMDDSSTANVSLFGVYRESLNAFSRTMANLYIINPTGRDGGKISASKHRQKSPKTPNS